MSLSWRRDFGADASILRGERVSFPFDLPSTTVHGTLEHLVIPYFGGTAGEKQAIIFGDRTLTFTELNAQANALARSLRKRLGYGKHRNPTCIGLHMGPSDSVIVAIFAVLKLGAAYLPLDPKYPSKRLKRMVETSKPLCVITDDENCVEMGRIVQQIQSEKRPDLFKFDDLSGKQAIRLYDYRLDESDLLTDTSFNRDSPPACILYTSGSTGLPKGVIISHKAILHRVSALWSCFSLTSEDVGCFKSSLSFVDSISEIFGFTLHGNPIVVAPYCITSTPKHFLDLLDNSDVTWLMLVPTLLDEILCVLEKRSSDSSSDSDSDNDSDGDSKSGTNTLQKIKYWVSTGEDLSIQLAQRFFDIFPEQSLCNIWGATELTGDVTHSEYKLKDMDDVRKLGKMPIGAPIQNTNIYILDENMQLVALNERGIAYVSGPNISDGYLNDTGTNSIETRHTVYDAYFDPNKAKADTKRFLPNTFDYHPQHQTLYNTGDYLRAVRGATGEIQLVFEGRMDSQVKVRGFRIDLSEIDAAVYEIPGVMRAHTFCHTGDDNKKTCVSYFKARDFSPACDVDIVTEHLKMTLPSFTIPTGIVPVDEFPLLPNGKVDPAALHVEYKESLMTPEEREKEREEKQRREEEEIQRQKDELKRIEEERKERQEELARQAEERRREQEEMMKKAQEEFERKQEEKEKQLREEQEQLRQEREMLAKKEEEALAEKENTPEHESSNESENEEEKSSSDEDKKEEEKEIDEDEELGSDDEVVLTPTTMTDGLTKFAVIKLTSAHEQEEGEKAKLVTARSIESDTKDTEEQTTEDKNDVGVKKPEEESENTVEEETKPVDELTISEENSDVDNSKNNDPPTPPNSPLENKEFPFSDDKIEETKKDEPMAAEQATPESKEESVREENEDLKVRRQLFANDEDQPIAIENGETQAVNHATNEEIVGEEKDVIKTNEDQIVKENGEIAEVKVLDENGNDDEKKIAEEHIEEQQKETNKENEDGADNEIDRDVQAEEIEPEEIIEPSENELLIIDVISEVLGLSKEEISMENDFFLLGGNSLNAILAINKLQDGGLLMKIEDFFQAQHLGDLLDINYDVTNDDFDIPEYEAVSLHESTVKELEIGCQLAVEGFVQKEPLTVAMDIPVEEKKSYLDTGMKMVAIDGKDYSFLIRKKETHQVVGMVINMDFSERNLDDAEVQQIPSSQLKAFSQYSTDVEKWAKDELGVTDSKQWLVQLVTVISENMDVHLKASLLKLMQLETLKVAKQKNFVGACGIYTHPLATSVATAVGLETNKLFDPIKDYTYDGEKYFDKIEPQDTRFCVMSKKV
ncbi:uncharacterized protein LOC100373219 [Saccoglossus kowalevskii]|uniref:Uncharacterized protein LOC100373219 n=1 Tax=Saccoglossus kowalevskii TaxID=10224 RepID=A0ABM0MEI3_SACKO|nr:PREDICTED: uncharacterized protein LOC100373219 [Saccoglossus kowalevskii]